MSNTNLLDRILYLEILEEEVSPETAAELKAELTALKGHPEYNDMVIALEELGIDMDE